jgi:hypothetical protein
MKIKLRRMRWVGQVACMGEIKNTYKILVVKPKGKRAHGRCMYRQEVIIRMDLTEIGWKDMVWMHLA